MSPLSIELAWSELISLVLIVLGAYSLIREGVRRHRQADSSELTPTDCEHFERQYIRRRNGSVVMILAGIIIFVAQNVVDHERSPRIYAWLWIGVLLAVLWMVTLSLADLLAIRRYGRRHLQNLTQDRREMLRQQIARIHSRGNGSVPRPPDSDAEAP